MGVIFWVAFTVAILTGLNLFVYIAIRYLGFVEETFDRSPISCKGKRWAFIISNAVTLIVIALIIIAEELH